MQKNIDYGKYHCVETRYGKGFLFNICVELASLVNYL